jgi:pseudaminic acid biosynthesis-associated methylase
MKYKTDQEDFWAGNFGTEYLQRNQGDALLASNLNFFVNALRATHDVKSCIEFGSNIGMNLKALKLLNPKLEQHAIEINPDAAVELSKSIPPENVYQSSILEFESDRKWDLVLIKGVLIHINPEELVTVYDKLVSACAKFILIAEYYNPSPISIDYRGHSNRLFKRDFAGEIMDRNPNLALVDYGFLYRRDPLFPQDDITWFLLKKNN